MSWADPFAPVFSKTYLVGDEDWSTPTAILGLPIRDARMIGGALKGILATLPDGGGFVGRQIDNLADMMLLADPFEGVKRA